MIQADRRDSMTSIVVVVLAVLMVAWGWMRAHSSVETVPVSGEGLNSPMNSID